jgi:hypothetical protein
MVLRRTSWLAWGAQTTSNQHMGEYQKINRVENNQTVMQVSNFGCTLE